MVLFAATQDYGSIIGAMTNTASPRAKSKNAANGVLGLQGLVAIATVCFALTPASGGIALYVSPGNGSAAPFQWAHDVRAGVIARGPWPGSVFVRVPSARATLAALRQGALLISVPEALCGHSLPKEPNPRP